MKTVKPLPGNRFTEICRKKCALFCEDSPLRLVNDDSASLSVFKSVQNRPTSPTSRPTNKGRALPDARGQLLLNRALGKHGLRPDTLNVLDRLIPFSYHTLSQCSRYVYALP